VLLVALVVGAVALAATSGSAPTPTPSHLDVGAGPPTTATALVTYADSSGVSVTASCAFDFHAGTASVTATADLSEIGSTIEARLVSRTLYVNLNEFSSLLGADWVSLAAKPGPNRLPALAEAMRHPDVARLHGHRHVTVHRGATTTTIAEGTVQVPFAPRLPIVAVPPYGRLTVSVTTGPQGQLLGASLRLVSRGDTVLVGVQVTGYDVPVSIGAPPAHDTVPLTRARARAIFGTDAPAFEHDLRALRALTG
jgi:hypothetical protein